ncbi:MAG: class I SAM-dependent methyltransferase [Chitinispirillaceae bacterium]|jgi:ubiquinone/menaquinone biosynthesis C-methylase UbiE|nr:class I SAM-dependent methyltransferase [Chitinispirillaceae bacterium]
MKNYNYTDVIRANRLFHTALADNYRKDEPHYRPENTARVQDVIAKLQEKTCGRTLLDIGCGSGFIIDLAKNLFPRIWGIDITPAMLKHLDRSSTRCTLGIGMAFTEKLPFKDDCFDVCTAHAVLHHLFDVRPALAEAFRVLRKGGIFYSDLDPNAYFWEAMAKLSGHQTTNASILREINAVKEKDSELAQELGIQKELIQKAEPVKHLEGGLKEDDLLAIARQIGFSSCEIKYEWFLGEAAYIHTASLSAESPAVRKYLHDTLPLTRHLYKYISIRAVK